MMELDPKRPYSALEILRDAGHEELGQEYVKASQAFNRCGNALMRMQMDAEEASREEFSEVLRKHPGFQSAKLAKEAIWTRIELVRDKAQARIFTGLPNMSRNEPAP